MDHRQDDELTGALDHLRGAPRNEGTLEMIVRRPVVDEREVLAEGRLDVAEGLVGDSWKARPSSRSTDGGPHPDMQLNIMSARVIDLLAGDRERWPLAGDQLYVDLDLSGANLPPGSRLSIGNAEIEVTDQPHTGCAKFTRRFGLAAHRFVNSELGRSLNLRGINARVVRGAPITTGDTVRVVSRPASAPPAG